MVRLIRNKSSVIVSPSNLPTSIGLLFAGYVIRDNGLIIEVSAYDARIYEFRQSNDLVQSATVTDTLTFTNPTNDRDWVNETYASASGNGEARRYDFGDVSSRIIFVRGLSGVGNYWRLEISSDGSNWTNLFGLGISVSNYVASASFRYIRFYNASSPTYLQIHEIHVFNRNNYTNRFNVTSSTPLVHMLSAGSVNVIYEPVSSYIGKYAIKEVLNVTNEYVEVNEV